MFGVNTSTNKNHKLYNSTVQTISRGVGDCATKSGDLCNWFVEMGELVKTQVENRLNKIFDFRGQTLDMSDQAVFALKDSGLRDEEGKKININDLLTETHKRSGCFVSFMITVHQNQVDTKYKHSSTIFRACVKLPLNINGTDACIDTQITKKTYYSSPLGGFGQWKKSRYCHTQEIEGGHIF